MCVEFFPAVINMFLGRIEREQPEVEVSDNTICGEIFGKHVKEWPRRGKLYTSCLSVKYVILHKIRAANWMPTNHTSSIATVLGRFIYIVGTKINYVKF